MIDPNEFPSPCGVCGLKSLDGTGDYRPDNSVSVPLRGLWFEILVLGSLISCGFAVRFAARICFLPIFYVA